ncbi:MAG: tetratricopeptide repeat protein [Simkaniaceae bacterium]
MKNTLFIPPQHTPHFTLPSHTITWEQDISHLKKGFSPKELDRFLDLYAKGQENPQKIQKGVELFKEDHPDHPEVLNLLTYVYLSKRKVRKANQLIQENYEKNPLYIFARINYADLCLRRKHPQKIPEIFDQKFNLRELYPEKKVFHVSEFRGFMVLMGFYHLSLGKQEAAEGYHYLAQRVDPHHPSTKILEKKLYIKSFYKRLVSSILNKVSRLTNIIKKR